MSINWTIFVICAFEAILWISPMYSGSNFNPNEEFPNYFRDQVELLKFFKEDDHQPLDIACVDLDDFKITIEELPTETLLKPTNDLYNYDFSRMFVFLLLCLATFTNNNKPSNANLLLCLGIYLALNQVNAESFSIEPTEDSHVTKLLGNTNSGGSDQLKITNKVWSGCGGSIAEVHIAYVKFAAIHPPGGTFPDAGNYYITKATLSGRSDCSSPQNSDIVATICEDFSEDSINYNNRPTQNYYSLDREDTYKWDITDIMRQYYKAEYFDTEINIRLEQSGSGKADALHSTEGEYPMTITVEWDLCPLCANGVCDSTTSCDCINGWNQTLCDNPICGDGLLVDGEECDPLLVNNCSNDCTCELGFLSDGFGNCEDINECEENPNICPEIANCTNIPGSFECICDENINDCVVTCTPAENDCHIDAICTVHSNNHTNKNCTCKSGYHGDGYQCISVCDIENGGCDVNASCTPDVDGSPTCECLPGFQGNGTNGTCQHKCSISNGGCHQHSQCSIDPTGEVICTCNIGYFGNGDDCTPHCEINNGGCGELANCSAIQGSDQVLCQCEQGYSGDGYVCVSNVCRHNRGGCDVVLGVCTPNDDNEPVCSCQNGYVMVADNDCEPICNVSNGGCDSNAICNYSYIEDTVSCECEEGFAGDGYKCNSTSCDIGNGGCDVNAECSVGDDHTVKCACQEGYSGDGLSCDNIQDVINDQVRRKFPWYLFVIFGLIILFILIAFIIYWKKYRIKLAIPDNFEMEFNEIDDDGNLNRVTARSDMIKEQLGKAPKIKDKYLPE
eukprot:TRINITY_DN2807_c0_g2_i1.p1 TRINITY_DN2807_c0_g2~~TRINITY_DN2807_c0_g2_i1.p1  ORF type:complete len:791 (-),score=150.04 TRINITY_DN2807_c0_g2_i1:1545-3917(-)